MDRNIVFDIKYNGKIVRKEICISDKSKRNILNANNFTIDDLYINVFPEYFIYNASNLNNNNNNNNNCKRYFICNGKLISSFTNLYDLRDNEYNNIECFESLSGGGDITDIIGVIFQPIFKPIAAIGSVFKFIGQFFEWLGKFIYWFIMFIIWLFSDLLNPIKLIADLGNSVILIVATIFSVILNVFLGLAGFVVNTVGMWMQGFWGWDQSSLTKNDKASNYFAQIDRTKGKKCYLTNSNTVPFSILLGTILCPPVGVFMDLGLTGWFNILICTLLTLIFYVPGLFYALVIIYS